MKAIVISLLPLLLIGQISNARAFETSISGTTLGGELNQNFTSVGSGLNALHFHFVYDDHQLKSVGAIVEPNHRSFHYINFQDRVPDDSFFYSLTYARPSSSSYIPGMPTRFGYEKGRCESQRCEIDFDLPGMDDYLPVIMGFSLDYAANWPVDTEVTEITVMLNEENQLELAFREEGRELEFDYIVQLAWIPRGRLLGTHWEVNNIGAPVKDRATFSSIAPGSRLLRGFSFRYVEDRAGSPDDAHNLRRLQIDLDDGFVRFHDDGKDDLFVYRVAYATVL